MGFILQSSPGFRTLGFAYSYNMQETIFKWIREFKKKKKKDKCFNIGGTDRLDNKEQN